jgi:hypothetical protein
VETYLVCSLVRLRCHTITPQLPHIFATISALFSRSAQWQTLICSSQIFPFRGTFIALRFVKSQALNRRRDRFSSNPTYVAVAVYSSVRTGRRRILKVAGLDSNVARSEKTKSGHYKNGDAISVEPWRSNAFPMVRDLIVDRSALDRIIQAASLFLPAAPQLPASI